MTTTADLTIGGRHESVKADSVTIHRVTADRMIVRDILGGDDCDDFTSIDINNGSPTRQSHLFVHGTPGQRAIELLRIAHLLAEAAEALQDQNAEALR